MHYPDMVAARADVRNARDIRPARFCIGLGELKVRRGDFAALFLRVEADGLAVIEDTDAAGFERSGVNEHVLAAVVGSDKAKTFLAVIPFHFSSSHFRSFTNMALAE